ncbi:MAG: aminomethyl-transferring glycine dehydrogenase [Longimicrobiales bacterium]|nr:aminomethyl-transferring glycine dehydrogenase [Longimicrobiales bacterium]
MTQIFSPERDFVNRHLGPSEDEIREMLASLDVASLQELVRQTVPSSILREEPLDLPEAVAEHELLRRLRSIASRNRVLRSFIGMGYHGTLVPGVIQRNILENPGWYTQYTPYQAEIAQGRLEALLNFQTVCIDLTGLHVGSASLLDEGTAAAEAMAMLAGAVKGDRHRFLVSDACHPQTIAVLRTRAAPVGIEVVVGDWRSFDADEHTIGALVSYPDTHGAVEDFAGLADRLHEQGAYLVAVSDLLALTLLTPPGEWGADVVVGNSQRFGVPMGYGGPHAAFMTAREEFTRRMPGRIIGVSVDARGNRALRMALQTREQHIRREKATSNICTAQVLLAIMAGMYGVYHGPAGLRRIARRVHGAAAALARGVEGFGHEVVHAHFFDTLRVRPAGRSAAEVLGAALEVGINLRDFGDGTVGVALDETVSDTDLEDLLRVFGGGAAAGLRLADLAGAGAEGDPSSARIPAPLQRTTAFMEHPVFNSYHSETEMLRYIHRLETRDLSLNTSMIPLGSCTMKLNATTQMVGVTWPEFGGLHPFAPRDQAAGYQEVFADLEAWLNEITGFTACSLQPNSGAQGEYTGLQVIRAYHLDRGDGDRTVCLIPSSAHGTNPASAVMSGMDVKIVKVREDGSINLDDLRAQVAAHADRLAAVMITYPSTAGVFEGGIREICDVVHEHGGLVYLDGANLNAQVGLARPGDYGADVCHINLHKTFAIPHGGGGPGMGPICCNEKLAPFLPGHPVVPVGGARAIGPVSAAPWGSASILVISWAYIALLGRAGVRRASEVAILNANYMARRLQDDFHVLFRGHDGRVAHEFILDMRPFRKSAGITEEDVAKRLQDYGFHGPTMSWPVVGTIMVEPTESESKAELDRFCEALLAIRAEIREVELGVADREDNPLRNAPHTAARVTADEWEHSYTRAQAAYPAPWTRDSKFWPSVGRVDNAYGDRNLVCACPPVEEYATETV